MNNNRYCVYLHKDKNSNVVFVGGGLKSRASSKSKRSKTHLKVINDLTCEIVHENLSKMESNQIKDALIDLYQGEFLLNKHKSNTPLPLDHALLDEYFYYDETSPTFLRWKKSVPNGRKKHGDVAGTIDISTGYASVTLLKRQLKVHRIIYCLASNVSLDSLLTIDHIDSNPSNNAVTNLRLVSQLENNRNKSQISGGASKVRGVLWSEDCKRWSVYWYENLVKKQKHFSPKRMYPELESEAAKIKALEHAILFRKEKVELHYA